MEPTEQTAELRPVLLGLAATLAYLVTAPGVVNGDGLGYLKLLPHDFAAGHLLYMPMLRMATHSLGGDGLRVGRLLDSVLGGTGVLLTYALAFRLAPITSDRRFVATTAAMGLAVSYGYWAASADVEAYSLATVALLVLVRVALPFRHRPSGMRALAIGVALGVAVLTHLTHVLASGFVVAVCLDDPRGRRHGIGAALLALLTGGAVALSAYAYAAFVVRGHHLEGALRWVASASHGFVEPTGPYSIAAAVYGLCRSLLWSPTLDDPDRPRLLGQLMLGLALLCSLVAVAMTHRAAWRAMPGRVLGWLVVPYAALALVFFGADPERWIFSLPVLWIVAAVALDATHARRRWAVLTVAYVGLVNLALGIWPAHRDVEAKRRAVEAARVMSQDALVLFPGHAWDEYVSFYGAETGKRLEPFPLSYYLARDGEERMWARLDREVGAAAARGHAIYGVRLFDESDGPGFVEMRAIGTTPSALETALRARFVVTPIAVSAAMSVMRLLPR